MTCPNCNRDVIDMTTMGGPEEYQCPQCGAHWKERDGKIIWAAAPTRPINPADAIRELCIAAGYDVDEESFASARRYCDKIVESVEPLQALVPEGWHHKL